MTDDRPASRPDRADRNGLPPRLRRALELVYGIEGVTAARVWQWDKRVAIGVRAAYGTLGSELLQRVEATLAGVRDPDETWDFGLMEDEGL